LHKAPKKIHTPCFAKDLFLN